MYDESNVSEPRRDGGIERRDFLLSGATLSAGGAALGISFWFADQEKKRAPDLSEFSKPENQVRTGHIGVGNRGGSLLRTALQVPGSLPVAVCDKQPDKQNDYAKQIAGIIEKRDADRLSGRRHEVKKYDDYRRLLDDKDVEAVFIATPHYLHGPMAIDAIEAGKHVYCEKALAFTIGENQDIVRLVEAGAKTPEGKDLVFQVGHQRHYSPLYQRVAEMVRTDHIGDLVTIRAEWNLNDEISRPVPRLELERIINWRLYSEYSGGLATEYATHQIDVANWMFATHPYSVRGYGGVDWYGGDGRDTHDNIHLIFTYRVPVVLRDPFGRPKRDGDKVIYDTNPDGSVKLRQVTFDYMSSMANAHLSPPSELILGRYGTIQLSLAGGEFFKEKKARQDPHRIAEGTNPRRARQRSILKSGVTMAAGGGAKAGDPIAEKELPGGGKHWSHFIEPIEGAYDKIETLLAVESFLKCVRRAQRGQPFRDELRATARVGMESAVPALMANIATAEDRTVYWHEFFPDPT